MESRNGLNTSIQNEVIVDAVGQLDVVATNPNAQGNPAADANATTRSERSGRRSRGGRNRKNRDANRDENREPRDPNAVTPAFVPNDTVVDSTPIIVQVTTSSEPALQIETAQGKTEQPQKASNRGAAAKANKAQSAKPKADVENQTELNLETVQTNAEKSVKADSESSVEKPAKVKAEKKPAARKPAKAAKPAVAKPVDLSASGLQLVETKGDSKVSVAEVEPAKPRAPRKAPNWKKDAESKNEDAPLVMVETQK